MLIRVIYNDGKFDLIKPQLLNKLLNEKKLTSFKRSGGWATVGRDPLRKNRLVNRYEGMERRAG